MPPKTKKDKDQAQARPVRFGRPGNNLKIGIVGMPNVGKSTFFNLLSKLNVPAENFPFCTIDPNVAIVAVPDKRFDWLCQKYKPASEVPPTITVTDIAGLVKGASEGQGLGNAFLSHIAEVDAIYHIIRAFEGEVTHVEGDVDPIRDLSIIQDELLLKDLKWCRNTASGMAKNVARKIGGKEAELQYNALLKAVDFMEQQKRGVRFGEFSPHEIEALNKFNLITAKEQIYLVNVSKRDYLRKGNKWLPKINEAIENVHGGGLILPFSVEFEQDFFDLECNGPDALAIFKGESTAHVSMLPRILKQGYKALQLIHFFTAGADEVRAWTLKDGKTAPEAAGRIHSDIEKNFICAEVQTFEDLKALGDEDAVRKAGKLKQQGKKYVVLDGDVIYFKHNS